MAWDYSGIPATDLAYAAGVIDGEGCIRINRSPYGSHETRPTNYNLVVSVLTCDRVLPAFLHSLFGGSFRDYRFKSKRLHVHWSVRSAHAEAVLRALLPYLKLKREQAEVGLEFRKLTGNNGTRLTDENRSQRAFYFEEMKRLKVAGRTELVHG